jgi:hypothetical protein
MAVHSKNQNAQKESEKNHLKDNNKEPSTSFQGWKNFTPQNYRLVSLMEGRERHHVLVIEESSLYKVYATQALSSGRHVAYAKCINDDCECRGKIDQGKFIRTRKEAEDIHKHSDHSVEVESLESYAKLKSLVLSTRQHVRSLHTQTIREMSVEAARTIAWKKVGTTLKRLRRSIFPTCGDWRV